MMYYIIFHSMYVIQNMPYVIGRGYPFNRWSRLYCCFSICLLAHQLLNMLKEMLMVTICQHQFLFLT